MTKFALVLSQAIFLFPMEIHPKSFIVGVNGTDCPSINLQVTALIDNILPIFRNLSF